MIRNVNGVIERRFNDTIRSLVFVVILLALHCVGAALALDAPDTASLQQSTPAGNVSADSRTYLKQHEGKWFQVTRGNGAQSDIIVPASQPVSQTPASVVGSGIFAPYVNFPVGSFPEAVAIGDVNGDGRNDVVMTTYYYFDDSNDYKLFVFLQNSSGTLDPPVKYSTHGKQHASAPLSVAIGDVNHDGKNDVVVGLDLDGLDVFLQNSTGGLDSPVFYPGIDSSMIRVADLNHDGLLDVVGIGWGTDTASVWLQNATGILNAPVIYSVKHVAYDDLEVGDVNNDGLTDVIVMSGQGQVNNLGILFQRSNGTFGAPVYRNLGGDILTNGVAVGDISGDNRNDVVVTCGGNSPDSKISTFLQNASGTLNLAKSYSSYGIPVAVAIADVNNDGRKDVIVAHHAWNALGVYLQNDDGTLMPESLNSIPYTNWNPRGLAVGDINGDGSNDVVLADFFHGLVVLYNQNTATILTSPVTRISSTMATGGGNVIFDGGSTVTARGVCWNTAGSPTTEDQCTTDGSGTGRFTSAITGLTPSTTYHVRAYATNAGGTGYGDEKSFSTLDAIKLISPNGNEVWVAGDVRNIIWSHTGVSEEKVRIQLYKGNVPRMTITPGIPMNASSFSWTIPDTLPAGTDYRIKITSTTNGTVSDMSDNPFTITSPTISITSPNGGEVLNSGSTIPITWNHTGYAGNSDAKVIILLYMGKIPFRLISTGTSLSAGVFNWNIPTALTRRTKYKIKVSSKTNWFIGDLSDNYFSIDN